MPVAPGGARVMIDRNWKPRESATRDLELDHYGKLHTCTKILHSYMQCASSEPLASHRRFKQIIVREMVM